jgi:NADH:ubiquinone oxidoreductase subunit 3 (subunit A)
MKRKMKKPFGFFVVIAVLSMSAITARAQVMKVTLLGTGAGPPVNLERYEAGTSSKQAARSCFSIAGAA